ncbi:Fe-S cluster assembly protein IscX [Candidatus Neoehrlichia procyonis]|uniref:FeS assembly protein IscX n=1 Tax=Candidatus Neoehrlichia procyonis str. RAC413 TaxID=1359163 RepID=A0A0F3NNH9_9RICK|nr:Fe-S cluster assembly protein IscX [Candidatus Neoehrlichia lotoris]KJV69600.1 feS assembly protein IscX [Candidatus Neoehrlichia lotoris str. RAC413]
MKWVDIEDIVNLLEENYPDTMIFNLRFTDLQQMVMGLPGFDDDSDKCNEKILEAIQIAWHEERNNC